MGDGGGGGEGKNFKEYIIAGGIAGSIARTCIAPIERVKILYQIQSPALRVQGGKALSPLEMFPHIVRTQGILSLWNGNMAGVVRVFPYAASHFVFFEEYRFAFKRNALTKDLGKNPINLLSGSAAGITAVSLTYPLDLVRARVATHAGTSTKTSMGEMLAGIMRTSGVRALYTGITPTLIGVAPYAGLKFATYEGMKVAWSQHLGLGEPTPGMRLVCGTLAGLIAQTFVYPFDVMRRRMQTHGLAGGSAVKYQGVFSGLAQIAREEGIRKGLFRGLSLNYLKTAPNVAIMMTVYDLIKIYLLGASSDCASGAGSH